MYEIARGMKPGVALTVTQRTSSLFSEEPRVLGRVLRRGSPPLLIEDGIYETNKVEIDRLVKAGSISVRQLGDIVEARTTHVIEEPPVVEPEPVVSETAETVPGIVPVEEVVETPVPVAEPVVEAPVVEPTPEAVVLPEPIVEQPVETKSSSRKRGRKDE